MANELARSLRKTMTSHEVKLWVCLRELRPQGLHFRRQVSRVGYILEFACLKARLAIEVDGSQHARDEARSRDRARDSALCELGFAVLRIWNTEIDENLDGVVETVIHQAHQRMQLTQAKQPPPNTEMIRTLARNDPIRHPSGATFPDAGKDEALSR